jgi:hypothetical protein
MKVKADLVKWELVSTIGGYKDSLMIIAKLMDYL